MKIHRSRFLGALFLGLAVWLALFTPAKAWTATSLYIVGIMDDLFYNYDFTSRSASQTNVDWAITMVFYENADVDKVKGIYWGPTGFGNEMHANISDYFSLPLPTWVSDRGTKDWNYWCETNWAHHMRVYGRLYNVWLGYYVLATTHMDLNECVWPPQPIFGFSEYAEQQFSDIAQYKGYFVQRNYFYLANSEPDRWQYWLWESHYWNNDAYATRVRVP